MELLQSLTGARLTHVPYKGSGPALTDLVGGQIQAMLLTMPAAMPFVKGGKVRAIATSGAQRSPALAELPTIAEAGVPGYEYMPWYGLFGPATLPKALADRLYEAALEVARRSRMCASAWRSRDSNTARRRANNSPSWCAQTWRSGASSSATPACARNEAQRRASISARRSSTRLRLTPKSRRPRREHERTWSTCPSK